MVLGCFAILIGFMLTKHYVLAASLSKDYQGPVLMIKEEENMTTYENYDEVVKRQDENVYIDLDTISNHLKILTDYDANNGVLVITSTDKIIRFYQDGKVKMNQNIVENIPPMKKMDEKIFIPINKIAENLRIKYTFVEENGSIILENQMDKKIIAKAVKNNVNVRFEATSWSHEDDFLQEDEAVEVLKEEGEWVKVLTPRGKTGYVQKKELKDQQEVLGLADKNKPVWKPESGKIILTWEHVFSKNPEISKIGALEGVNVISPTWITLTDASGTIKNKISNEYIYWAKSRGYKIWPLFTNDFNPDMTNEFFQNAGTREKVINDLAKLVKENNMDGINIDFENVYLKDKERLVIFVRELTSVFHENNLVVSIDVTVRGGSENWSQCYDRGALGEVVDYIALMAYDEHWGSSPVSGSVASMGWVEKGIKGLLEEVPSEKLILGVPFYTRIWMETPTNEDPNKMNVKSKAVKMEAVNEILEKDGIEKVWDEESGQNYVEYVENNILHKIWIEDEKSMQLRADFVSKYDLAGIATWRRGFETEDIWTVIEERLTKK